MMTEISNGHWECNMYQILETKEDKSIHGPAPIESAQYDFQREIRWAPTTITKNITIYSFIDKNEWCGQKGTQKDRQTDKHTDRQTALLYVSGKQKYFIFVFVFVV